MIAVLTSMRTSWTGGLLVVAAALLLPSCGTELEAPPIEITYRPSLLGAGNIVRLKNQSNQPLEELEITIRSTTGEVSYEEPQLAGFGEFEVGWKKLGGFEIPDGAEVEVKVKGYLLAASARLETTTDSDGVESESS